MHSSCITPSHAASCQAQTPRESAIPMTTFRDHLPTIAAALPAPAHLSHDICQIDLLASLADLTGQKLPKYTQANYVTLDSVDVLPALLGESPHTATS